MTDFQAYLHAKRAVDDRAIDRRVLDRLRAELPEGPLDVVEIGGGVGTGIIRLLDWGVLSDDVSYTAIDRRAENAAAAHDHLTERGFAEEGDRLRRDGVTVSLVTADAFDVLGNDYDLLVAQAFLDLVDLDSALPALFDALSPGGLAYFPITFDGGTIFDPEHPFDERVVEAYHRDMDRTGDSHAGRRLFSAIPEVGGEVLAAGGSDWVVYPPYSAADAAFLRHIIDTVEGALADEDLGDGFEGWLAARRAQIEREELTYIAHQLDVLARV